MPRLFGGVNVRKGRALACQVDEEEIPLPKNYPLGHIEEGSDKRRLSRSFKALKCLSSFSVLRELRIGCNGKEESCESCCDSSQAKYYLVVEEKDPSYVPDGSEVRLLFRDGVLDSGHDLVEELFNSTGSLKAVEEGNEWEEDSEPDEPKEKTIPACSSPTTLTTVKSDVSSQALESPFDIVLFEEPSFVLETDEWRIPEPTNVLRIGIAPIAFQPPTESPCQYSKRPKRLREIFPLNEFIADDCADTTPIAEIPKPDPPASILSDADLSYEYSIPADEQALGRFAAISVAKKQDCDRTVVSELTCETFGDFATSCRDQAECLLVRERLEDGMKEVRDLTQTDNRSSCQSEFLSVQERPKDNAKESRETIQTDNSNCNDSECPYVEERRMDNTKEFQDTTKTDKRNGDKSEYLLVQGSLKDNVQEWREITQSDIKNEEMELISQASSKKLHDLISKFESLSTSKVKLERSSAISKLQREEGASETTSSGQSSVMRDISTTSTEEKADTHERGFFWRSYPRSQELSCKSNFQQNSSDFDDNEQSPVIKDTNDVSENPKTSDIDVTLIQV